MYGFDNDFSMIPKKEENSFLDILKNYFKTRSVDHKIEVKEYIDKDSVYKIKRSGILLNQEQILHLVKVVFQRIKMINGLKAGARLSYKKDSLEARFFDGEDNLDAKEFNLKEKLENMSFYHFFEEV